MPAKFENQRPSRDGLKHEEAITRPTLQTEPPKGAFVEQGAAVISTCALQTSGLTTCTGVVIISKTHNFLAHADSETDPEWLAKIIKEFVEVGGPPIGVFRFHCHGRGLNEPAEKNTRQALESVDLMRVCQDTPSVDVWHTIIANEPGSSDRVTIFLQKNAWNDWTLYRFSWKRTFESFYNLQSSWS